MNNRPCNAIDALGVTQMFLNVGKTGICMINTDNGKGVLGESRACLIFSTLKQAIVVWKTETYKGQETQEWEKVST